MTNKTKTDSTAKTCNKCRELKDLTSFSKHKKSKDGLQYNCKDCAKIYKQNNDHSEYMKRYFATDSGREAKRRGNAINKRKFPEKIKAQKVLNNAIAAGNIYRPTTCSSCNKEGRIEAHHWSYLEEHWLDVVWLCRGCHVAEHKRLKECK